MQTVRKRILEILKRRSTATVSELASRLEMAPVSVRYHLDILQGDNLIEVSKVRKEGNVGRPKQVYSLTDQADEFFPTNFSPITSSLIEQMKKALPSEQVEAAFCAMAREMAEEFPDVETSESTERRLARITEFLNERGYLARWERATETEGPGADSFLLHTHNCPYAGVSSEHRELCCMDLELIRALVGRQCRRLDSLAEEGQCCSYLIPHGLQQENDTEPSHTVQLSY